MCLLALCLLHKYQTIDELNVSAMPAVRWTSYYTFPAFQCVLKVLTHFGALGVIISF